MRNDGVTSVIEVTLFLFLKMGGRLPRAACVAGRYRRPLPAALQGSECAAGVGRYSRPLPAAITYGTFSLF